MVRSLWTDTLGQYDGGTRQNGGMRNRASEPDHGLCSDLFAFGYQRSVAVRYSISCFAIILP